MKLTKLFSMSEMFMALALLLLATSAGAQTLIEDIAYGPKERNQFDLYLPEDVDQPPIVMFIHGGRWFRKDSTQVELYNRVNALTEAGIAIASINYTYSTDAIWPAQLDDVRAAMTFLRENGEAYGYDGQRLAVWGQSSGAHLALWAGLTFSDEPDRAPLAVVSWYAPSDLYALAADRDADDVPGGNDASSEPSPESILIGAEVPDNKDLADAASPAVFLTSLPDRLALPDFLLVHGTMDNVVSPLQTKRLAMAFAEQGGAGTVKTRYVEDGRHGGAQFDDETSPAVAFLTGVLFEGQR